MKSLVATLLLVLTLGAASALELPLNAKLTLIQNNTIVGVGEVDEGSLELDLQTGYSGVAMLTATDEAGNVFAYEVTIAVTDAGISVVVNDWETLTTVDLVAAVIDSGGEVDITYAADFADEVSDWSSDSSFDSDGCDTSFDYSQDSSTAGSDTSVDMSYDTSCSDAEDAAEAAADDAADAAEAAADDAADAAEAAQEETDY